MTDLTGGQALLTLSNIYHTTEIGFKHSWATVHYDGRSNKLSSLVKYKYILCYDGDSTEHQALPLMLSIYFVMSDILH